MLFLQIQNEKDGYMKSWELITTAIALAMDAFAVAICKGLATDKVKFKHMAIVGLWFGGFQALMPLIGYGLGSTFSKYIEQFDHWIAFGLLGIIGANMIVESFKKDDDEANASLGFVVMLTMALATSIDAMAVGISYAMIPGVDIVLAICSIGIITFALSAAGVKIGNIFGARYKCLAERIGGAVLCLMGLKILFEHLNFLEWMANIL